MNQKIMPLQLYIIQITTLVFKTQNEQIFSTRLFIYLFIVEFYIGSKLRFWSPQIHIFYIYCDSTNAIKFK
jgi:hypothetical protein